MKLREVLATRQPKPRVIVAAQDCVLSCFT